MSKVLKSRPSIVVILKLDVENVPRLLKGARNIVQRMTGNHWFPSPSPTLVEVEAAIDALDAAEVRTLKGAPDSVPERDAKRRFLVQQRLEQLRDYVGKIANDNPDHCAEIAESAGMYLKRLRGPAPQVFDVEPGSNSGEVNVTAPRAGDRAAYEFQYSLDGGVTWRPFPQVTTTKASATLTGLKPGSKVHFRYRAMVKGVTGNWSDPLAIIVG